MNALEVQEFEALEDQVLADVNAAGSAGLVVFGNVDDFGPERTSGGVRVQDYSRKNRFPRGQDYFEACEHLAELGLIFLRKSKRVDTLTNKTTTAILAIPRGQS